MLTLIGIILFYLDLFLQRKFKKIQQQKPNVSACDQLSEGPPALVLCVRFKDGSIQPAGWSLPVTPLPAK